MSGVKKYHIGDSGLVEGEALGRISVVLSADFDRFSAGREALQQRLTVQDQRVDDLENELQQLRAGYKWESERSALLLAELQDSESATGSMQPAMFDPR